MLSIHVCSQPDISKKMFYRAVLYGGIQFSINFHAVSLAAEFLAVPIMLCRFGVRFHFTEFEPPVKCYLEQCIITYTLIST